MGNVQALLEARGLTVRYRGTGVPALRGVDLEVGRGEVVGLLGESGAGKTTLALALLGLLPVSATRAGEVRAGGRIALVFQEPALSLNPVLRAGFQLTEVLRTEGRGRGRAARAEAARRFEEVGLLDARFLAAYPHELSGGQRQRVALAQALAGDPALVVADEPTAALDPTLRAEVLALLEERRRSRGLALLFITHQPRLLAGWADRVIVLYAGEVVEEGPAAEVLEDPRHPYTQGLLRALPPPLTARTSPQSPRAVAASPRTPLAALPGDPPGLNMQPKGCLFEPRCADRMEVCRAGGPGSYPVVTAGTGARRARCFKYGP